MIALVTVFGYVVWLPFSVGVSLAWCVASLAPPAIYLLGSRGMVNVVSAGVLILLVTLSSWGAVASDDGGGFVGVYPIFAFAVTMIVALVAAAVGSATGRRGQ